MFSGPSVPVSGLLFVGTTQETEKRTDHSTFFGQSNSGVPSVYHHSDAGGASGGGKLARSCLDSKSDPKARGSLFRREPALFISFMFNIYGGW